MKLTKENIYVPLEGYSEEERIEIVEFLLSINEPCKGFLKIHIKRNKTLEFWGGTWFTNHSAGNKTPVTIEQLKEILQPETLQEKEQRLLKELEDVRKEIEEQNKPKVGDWVVNTHHGSVFKNNTINLGINHLNRYKKITNPQLIELLEQEIK